VGGFSSKVPQRRFVNIPLQKKKRKIFLKRGSRNTLANLRRIHHIAVQDESIFVHMMSSLIKRKLWHPKGTRPIVTIKFICVNQLYIYILIARHI